MLRIKEENFSDAIHDIVNVITKLKFLESGLSIEDKEKLKRIEKQLLDIRDEVLGSIEDEDKQEESMDIKKVFEKGLKGTISVLIALIIANVTEISTVVVGLIPEDIAKLTVAGLVAFIVNAGANYLKHRSK